MTTRRTFVKEVSCAAAACAVGCSNRGNGKEATMGMKFSELIEARRSVRKYAKAEISKDEMAKIGIPEKEVLMSVIAVGKSAQKYFKNPRKPVTEVLKVV